MLKQMTQTKLTLVVSFLLTALYNISFFKNVTSVYPIDAKNFFFLCSLAIGLYCAISIVLNTFRAKVYFKPMLIFIFILTSLLSYAMDNYNIVFDDVMFLNMVKSDSREMLDLISFKLFIYLALLGILPSLMIMKLKIHYFSKRIELKSRLKAILGSLAVLLVMMLSFSKFYASFLREHKPLRYYANPLYFIYSGAKFATKQTNNHDGAVAAIDLEAKLPDSDVDRELIIFVVGETARADRFSLNGYKKETNPLLSKEEVVSFTNVMSCGTSTAVSVPCMFSKFGRKNYTDDHGKYHENLLDLLTHTKEVHVLWRDNNSDSKGVAVRVEYQDYRSPSVNTICNTECRDEGMLVGLQDYIDVHPTGDIFIILHQMGNHGPAYYKRYPAEFEKFKPTCKTNELSECSSEEIDNSYDNAILYTDYFLSKVIALLKKNSNKFEAGMVYVSDHGESLGENGIYLHAMPYMMAPVAQIHVPLIMWFGGELRDDIDLEGVKKIAGNAFSHDNIFHTILGLMEVESVEYKPKLNILHNYSEHLSEVKEE